jgi:TorA maturation chaperone TorD
MELSDKLFSANIYKFLSECFYYPDENQIKLIKRLASKLPHEYSGIFTYKQVKDLQVDYARLFVGPFELLSPPYGSVYLDEGRKTFGESTVDVVQHYKSENLNVELKEPPDHIAIELEFMFYLISKEVECIVNKDFITAEKYLNKQRLFITEHISAWVNEFSSSLTKNSNTECYKKLASVLLMKINTDLKQYYKK